MIMLVTSGPQHHSKMTSVPEWITLNTVYRCREAAVILLLGFTNMTPSIHHHALNSIILQSLLTRLPSGV